MWHFLFIYTLRKNEKLQWLQHSCRQAFHFYSACILTVRLALLLACLPLCFVWVLGSDSLQWLCSLHIWYICLSETCTANTKSHFESAWLHCVFLLLVRYSWSHFIIEEGWFVHWKWSDMRLIPEHKHATKKQRWEERHSILLEHHVH